MTVPEKISVKRAGPEALKAAGKLSPLYAVAAGAAAEAHEWLSDHPVVGDLVANSDWGGTAELTALFVVPITIAYRLIRREVEEHTEIDLPDFDDPDWEG